MHAADEADVPRQMHHRHAPLDDVKSLGVTLGAHQHPSAMQTKHVTTRLSPTDRRLMVDRRHAVTLYANDAAPTTQRERRPQGQATSHDDESLDSASHLSL